MVNNQISILFTPTPAQWGLRGDPHLWAEMKSKAETIDIPNSIEDLEIQLHNWFEEFTGEKVERGKTIRVRRYPVLGMSSGIVHSDFWLDKGFPLIIQRYRNLYNIDA